MEVVIPGASATGFRSRTSTDEALREPTDLASLIANEPGVHIRRLGGDESPASLSIRGTASSQVGILLAGIPLTSAADPSLDLSSLPLFPGASVHVYKSFVPAILGTSGHLGGVLALDPPTLSRGSRTESWVGLGSFGSQKLRIADLRRVGKTSFATSLSASRASSDFEYFADDPAHPQGGRMRKRQNAGHAAVSGIERVETDFGWGRVGATLFAQAREQGVAGPSRYPTHFPSLHTSRLGGGADLTLRTGSSESATGIGIGAFRFAGYGTVERSRFRDPRGEIDPTRKGVSTDDSIQLVGASASWRGIVGKGLIVDGIVDGRSERFLPGEAQSARSPKASRHSLGIGGDAELKVERLALAGTLRADFRQDDSGGAKKDDLFLTGHMGMDYRLFDWLSLASHAGLLARPPSFVESFGDRGAILGNANLQSEAATTIDAGFRGRARGKRLVFAYELSGFHTWARDLITFIPHGRSALRAENLDRARLVGLELASMLQGGPIMTRIGYTALWTTNEGDDALERGKPLPGRPSHDLSWDTIWKSGPLGLRYSLDVVAETTMDPKATILLPVRSLHGLGASFLAIKAPELVLGARVDNLLDSRIAHIASPATGRAIPYAVSDFIGYPMPGRSFWVTAKVVVR